jgi:hypothetical protein
MDIEGTVGARERSSREETAEQGLGRTWESTVREWKSALQNPRLSAIAYTLSTDELERCGVRFRIETGR